MVCSSSKDRAACTWQDACLTGQQLVCSLWLVCCSYWQTIFFSYKSGSLTFYLHQGFWIRDPVHFAHVLCLPTFKKEKVVNVPRVSSLCQGSLNSISDWGEASALGLRHSLALFPQVKPVSCYMGHLVLSIFPGLSPIRGIGVCPIASMWPFSGPGRHAWTQIERKPMKGTQIRATKWLEVWKR